MKIKDLKRWLNTLPSEMDECEMVFRKIIPCDDENWLASDKPISACGIDAGSNEAYFCDEKSYQTISVDEFHKKLIDGVSEQVPRKFLDNNLK